MASATSFAVPMRPNLCSEARNLWRFSICSSVNIPALLLMRLGTAPGETQLTLTPAGPNSEAKTFVNISMAPLVAA
ncbi:uncharacterized protein METZ01_LOCUS116477 [marine metagenome]|uniref:Uncharacterized protein n=1 Tax=marine metagenome TaxID=408172 RepID=A0A381XH70_9ZZZZ